MSLQSFIRAMPKVELHVHLEGSIQPATLLTLARRNGVRLPASSVDGLRQWYQFSDFPHFVEVYLAISRCICGPDDIELIAREFLEGQAAQNVWHSEVTYTAITHYLNHRIPFADQLSALNRAAAWAKESLGVTMSLTIDHPRNLPADVCLRVADWAISGMDYGVTALGLGGPEVGNPPERFQPAFDRARAAGLASVPHAGETEGAASVWGALQALGAQRIGHGVRCLEDPALVEELRQRRIPLEVCPTSNVRLRVVPSIADHPLPQLFAEGLYVTINSDDPPMFGTTLTDEYLAIVETFGLDADVVERLVINAVRASLLPEHERTRLEQRVRARFAELRTQLLGGADGK